jgi:hypothetical protein
MNFPEPVLIEDTFAVNDEFHVEKLTMLLLSTICSKIWIKVRNCFIYAPPFNSENARRHPKL